MPHTNKDELSRLFGTFCHLWTKGLHANVQMKKTGSGGVVAQFEFKLDKPHKSFRRGQPQRAPRRHPGHEPGSPHAPGHPGAAGGSRRRPRRQGPKAIERSRLPATAHQASLAAARCSAPTTAIPYQPCASPASLWTNDNPVDQGCTEADQPPFEFLTGGRPGQQRG